MGGRSSLYVTALPSLVDIDIVIALNYGVLDCD